MLAKIAAMIRAQTRNIVVSFGLGRRIHLARIAGARPFALPQYMVML
jgi:hypothetical protein